MSVATEARPPTSEEGVQSGATHCFPKPLLPLLVPLAGDALKWLDTQHRGGSVPPQAPAVMSGSGSWIAVAQSCRADLHFSDTHFWLPSLRQRRISGVGLWSSTDGSGPSTSRGSSTLSLSGDLVTPSLSSESALCFPDCKDVQGSFFNTRHDACVARAYGSAGVVGLVAIAVDHPGGSSAKRYQTIESALLPSFVEGVVDPLQRNFYCLVDDVHPVAPFFDVDGSFDSLPTGYWEKLRVSLLAERPAGGETPPSPAELRHAALEDILVRTLEVLRAELVRFFSLEGTVSVDAADAAERSPSVHVDSVLVLCASDCGGAATQCEGKISFHLHFTLVGEPTGDANRNTSPAVVCFDSVMHHKSFAETLSHRLLQQSTQPDDPFAESAALVLGLLDLTVYSRWRPFRLPYCLKSFDLSAFTGHSIPLGDESAVAHRCSLSERVALQDSVAGVLSRTAAVGCTTLSVCVTCNPHHEDLCVKYPSLALRPLLPLSATSAALRPATRAALATVPCVTAAESVTENTAVAFVHHVFRMASIVHEGPFRANKRGRDSDTSDGSSREPRAFPVGRRVAVTSWAMRQHALRLFQCLHPTAFSSLRAEHLNLVFEDGGQRAWYVYQKQNKYCLLLRRYHQHTCGQLYLTYNSVKFRCYSNDCGTRKCWQCKWERRLDDPSSEGGSESPNYETLTELRGVFFPELTTEELAIRYRNSASVDTEKDCVEVDPQ